MRLKCVLIFGRNSESGGGAFNLDSSDILWLFWRLGLDYCASLNYNVELMKKH